MRERHRVSAAARHRVRRKRSVFVGPRKTTDRLSKHQLLRKRHKSVQSPREKFSHEFQRRKFLQEQEDEGKRRRRPSIPDRRLQTASIQDRSWEGTSQSADTEWGRGRGHTCDVARWIKLQSAVTVRGETSTPRLLFGILTCILLIYLCILCLTCSAAAL